MDDSPTARIKIDLELRSMKIASDCAETGEQALQMLEKKNYDIIFLDIVMPGADGYEICKIIRRHPQTKRTPVVMLTSKSSPFDRIRGSLSGCNSYLTKPVEHLKFRAVVEKTLSTVDESTGLDKSHGLAMGT
ncbi:PleD family two-component system response regulator [Undibacterium sp. KW1]|uniref:response regulator n=1 Tax=Undibacterium sp. KW1 TaxID=2058624 RepID=UPI0013898458|nr:response regulator [Undibacterium sp. KW1]